MLLLVALLAAQVDNTATLEMVLSGARSTKGEVRCGLWKSAQGFPTDSSQAFQTTVAKVEGDHAVCRFHVAPGSYAFAAFHDENLNGKFDRNFLGIPQEGHAASRNARQRFGPPAFEDARFEYAGGSLQLKATLTY